MVEEDKERCSCIWLRRSSSLSPKNGAAAISSKGFLSLDLFSSLKLTSETRSIAPFSLVPSTIPRENKRDIR